MKLWLLQFIRFLVLTRQHAGMLSSTQDTFSDMSELTDLCPYTSFCSRNATAPFPFSEDYMPCCQSCSCDSNCGFRGNCCFSRLDKFYTERKQTIVCRSAFVVEPSLAENLPDAHLYRYRMIDVCKTNNSEADMNSTSCEQTSSDAVEAFHPVVSRYTGFIYTNALCALCNNVSDAVPWQRAVTCSPNAEVTLSETLENFMSGKRSALLSGCHVYYTPPPGFNLTPAQSCNAVVIRTCNKNRLNETSQYRKLCERFNATFTVRSNSLVFSYANVYCLLCDMPTYPMYQRKKQCLKSGYLQNYKTISGFRLTVLLDIPTHDQNPDSKNEEKNNCSVNSVAFTPFKKDCRRVRCPWGQILLKSRCGYYSKLWVGGPFSLMLRLKPVKRNALLSNSFFKDMPEHHKNDRHALWFNRRTVRRWRLLVLYHVYQDKSAVEYIVVKATYPSMSVNPQHLKTMVQEALDDTWQILYKNLSFDFMVDFNECVRYTSISSAYIKNFGINITEQTERYVYYPTWLFCMIAYGPYPMKYKDVLYSISSYTKEEINAGIPITKLFFCDQVDLLSDEYDYKCGTVFFNVKNKTIHTFGIISSRNLSIRVCLDEFDHNYNSGLVTPFYFIAICTIFYISIFSEVFFV